MHENERNWTERGRASLVLFFDPPMLFFLFFVLSQWRIQDFPQGGAPTPKIAIIFQIFAKNCMKMKEFGPPGGARVPGAPPWIRQCIGFEFAFDWCE